MAEPLLAVFNKLHDPATPDKAKILRDAINERRQAAATLKTEAALLWEMFPQYIEEL